MSKSGYLESRSTSRNPEMSAPAQPLPPPQPYGYPGAYSAPPVHVISNSPYGSPTVTVIQSQSPYSPYSWYRPPLTVIEVETPVDELTLLQRYRSTTFVVLLLAALVSLSVLASSASLAAQLSSDTSNRGWTAAVLIASVWSSLFALVGSFMSGRKWAWWLRPKFYSSVLFFSVLTLVLDVVLAILSISPYGSICTNYIYRPVVGDEYTPSRCTALFWSRWLLWAGAALWFGVAMAAWRGAKWAKVVEERNHSAGSAAAA
ncbi:hypothetical protein M427DRAFT_151660 [Gonapodya prolifera JEL478]|uniref:Uncharacterized protein n=1 Tax=Gonapodya prolifera (strain JEL478) TaxID=1344416 RepID=A0A139AW47_GONPJ|nr:hypothetical protein M427DRAFT_151660 [Gonapodya prolifera JEL478]|eukprot:KXS20948.1 hypothetical protein M427DRAFT_151660 [Gonapodya prolifera JEL478]